MKSKDEDDVEEEEEEPEDQPENIQKEEKKMIINHLLCPTKVIDLTSDYNCILARIQGLP